MPFCSAQITGRHLECSFLPSLPQWPLPNLKVRLGGILIWAEQGAIGDRGTNPVLRRLRVFVEWGVLALAPGTEQKGLLSALQAGEPSGQRSPTGVFVLPKASTFPSLTISLSLSLLCPPTTPPSLPHAAPLLYGPIIFSLLHFLPLHFRICPSAQRQGSTLSLSSGAVFFPFFFSALVTQEKTFSREKKNVAARYTDKFETNRS